VIEGWADMPLWKWAELLGWLLLLIMMIGGAPVIEWMWGLCEWLYSFRWFTLGRCAYCGKWGRVFRDDSLHEQCWLDLK
jgi:hypothetical protein